MIQALYFSLNLRTSVKLRHLAPQKQREDLARPRRLSCSSLTASNGRSCKTQNRGGLADRSSADAGNEQPTMWAAEPAPTLQQAKGMRMLRRPPSARRRRRPRPRRSPLVKHVMLDKRAPSHNEGWHGTCSRSTRTSCQRPA